MHQRKFDEAVAAYRAAVEKDPEMSAAWYRIGVAKTAKNGEVACEAAYKPFKRCVDLDPDHMRAHYGLGDVLRYVRKDYARAEERFRAAIRLAPKVADAHRNLAAVLERREDLDGAIREMLEYIRLSGDPDGSGKTFVARLRIPSEAQARFPPPLSTVAARALVRSNLADALRHSLPPSAARNGAGALRRGRGVL